MEWENQRSSLRVHFHHAGAAAWQRFSVCYSQRLLITLRIPQLGRSSSIPPVEPKAGEMYLFQGSGVKKGKCTLEGLHARAYGYWQQMKTTEDLEGLEGLEFS